MSPPQDDAARAAQLDDIVRDIEACSSRARSLADDFAIEELVARPRPERWSAAECIAHLTLMNRPFVPLIAGAVAHARRLNRTPVGPYKADWLGRALAWSLEPGRLAMTTKAKFVPVDIGAPERVIADFLAVQDQIVSRVHAAADLPIDVVKIASPVDGRVKYNVYSAFRVIAAHERRHLAQAEAACRRAAP